MISKYKKVNIKTILLGIIIVVIIGGLGIALNASKSQAKTSLNIAQEFLKIPYTVDAEKIAEYNKMFKGSGGLSNLKAMKNFDKTIQPLMTTEGYYGLSSNRYNTLSTKVCVAGNYTLEVTDLILDKNLYGEKEDKAGYHYKAKLKFTSTNGKTERLDTAIGYIQLLKEDGQWKVSIYGPKSSPKLYFEILTKEHNDNMKNGDN